MSAVSDRLWVSFGAQVREARIDRRWTIRDLARRAGVSAGMAYRVESGATASTDTAQRLATALGRRAELQLVDPRRREIHANRTVDVVHSAMGELEAAHLRRLSFPVGIDEPYQHYQFAGRADAVAWDLDRAALLHIENRTRFPDVQETAGSFNAKRAYLGASLADRLGIRRWSSETHVIAALWSAEVLHVLRLREQSFRAICPDPADAFADWWLGTPPVTGAVSAFVVLDPLAAGRQRPFIGLDAAILARPRHRGYADVARLLG